MCSYCGCRANSVIARYTAEHESIINALGVLRRTVFSADQDAVAIAARELASLLDPHTAGEERELFAEMRRDPEFTAHVDVLCAEHHDIDGILARVAAGDRADVAHLEETLRRHIDKEENGLFPAAVIALDGQAWERVVSPAST